ncbi:MAG TPA: hypothetical protein VGN68_16800 [Sphingopyxis sp.]|jgi:hypothetical protein|uniref:hypothetical protein n=1 Tax=Sphingopyxis sp. TaxID=1908224 RepID=UPI002E124C5B|nr:hypothetical protein [Sphingopyxis sp.]
MAEMYTSLSADQLGEAFPLSLRDQAMDASIYSAVQLQASQWTEQFEVALWGESIRIPARLRFRNNHSDEALSGDVRLMVRCLRSRSSDGFERQRAVRDLLLKVEPWTAPFIVALIGEYVVEILRDVAEAFDDSIPDPIIEFLRENPAYWFLTKQRVSSYWNVYYRRSTRKKDYIGFKLTRQIDRAIAGCETTEI